MKMIGTIVLGYSASTGNKIYNLIKSCTHMRLIFAMIMKLGRD